VQQRGYGCTPCGRVRGGLARRIPSDRAVEIYRAADIEPIEPYPGNVHSPWRARCNACGDEISPTLATVRSRGRSCGGCGAARRGRAKRLTEEQAVERMRLAFLLPLEPYPGSVHSPWRCRCLNCGSIVRPMVSSVRPGRSGCMPCGIVRRSNLARVPGDVAYVVARAAGVAPLEPYPGKNSLPWRCRCDRCGSLVYPSYKVLKRGNGGCWECGQLRSGLTRRVPAAEAVALMRAAGYEPLEPYPTNSMPWRCRCVRCGTESSPTLGNVGAGKRCRACATFGLSLNDPAAVYLMICKRLAAVKVGVMNVGSGRTKEHRRNGWEPVVVDGEPVVVEVPTGRLAEQVERAVLRVWREELKAGVAVGPDQMPQGGFTETASLALVDPRATALTIFELCEGLDVSA
jgi:hypothetical protein